MLVELHELSKAGQTLNKTCDCLSRSVTYPSLRKALESNVADFLENGPPHGLLLVRKTLSGLLDEEVENSLSDIRRVLRLCVAEWVSDAQRHPGFLAFARKNLSNVISQWVYKKV
jgi:hypothetical protein